MGSMENIEKSKNTLTEDLERMAKSIDDLTKE
jgi:archaellum component FlaC